MQRRLGFIDLDTGEVVGGGLPVWVSAKIKSPYEDGWVAMNQQFLRGFAARKDVHEDVFRVFLFLDACLSFHNYIFIAQKDIANALGMHRQNVYRAMKKLEELNIIIRGEKIGSTYSWKLHPQVGWKGKTKDLKPAIENYRHEAIAPEKPN